RHPGQIVPPRARERQRAVLQDDGVDGGASAPPGRPGRAADRALVVGAGRAVPAQARPERRRERDRTPAVRQGPDRGAPRDAARDLLPRPGQAAPAGRRDPRQPRHHPRYRRAAPPLPAPGDLTGRHTAYRATWSTGVPHDRRRLTAVNPGTGTDRRGTYLFRLVE